MRVTPPVRASIRTMPEYAGEYSSAKKLRPSPAPTIGSTATFRETETTDRASNRCQEAGRGALHQLG